MAREAGSKIVTCPNTKCESRICGIPGESIVCKKCGTKVRLTKALLASEAAKKGTPVAPKVKAPKKAEKAPLKKMPAIEPVRVKRGRKPKAA